VILTPPPAVPGIAHANSNPPKPASRTRCRQTAFAAPPPAISSSPWISTTASSPASLTTRASTPASAARRFDPSPTGTIGAAWDAAQATTSSNSPSVLGSAYHRAGPPIPTVVNRASGTPSWIAIELRTCGSIVTPLSRSGHRRVRFSSLSSNRGQGAKAPPGEQKLHGRRTAGSAEGLQDKGSCGRHVVCALGQDEVAEAGAVGHEGRRVGECGRPRDG